MGDGVKAVFGAPRVAEDDAIRAVRAAVAMQAAFRALADEQRGRVGKTGLRVAVNTGEVVSDGETDIIGDPVNVAARLQEQGQDGDVVIGGSTQRIVASLVTLERLGSFALKGRSEQVEAYRVVSLAGRRALARDDLALAANLLGRALACLPAGASERADLALDWCEALLSAGDVGPAAGSAGRARGRRRGLRAAPRLAHLLRGPALDPHLAAGAESDRGRGLRGCGRARRARRRRGRGQGALRERAGARAPQQGGRVRGGARPRARRRAPRSRVRACSRRCAAVPTRRSA